MPSFLVTYRHTEESQATRSTDEPWAAIETTEWICPEGYDETGAWRSFENLNQTAQVIACSRVEE